MTSRPQTALFLGTGAVWAFRSLHSFTDPDFSDPDSVNDWLALLTLTLGLVLLAPAVLALPLDGWRRWLLWWTGAAAVLAGLANLVEDGLGQEWGGVLYVVGTPALLVGLLGISLGSLLSHPRWPAPIAAATLVGLVLLERGGGLLVLAGWLFAAMMVRRPAVGTPSGSS